MSTSGARPQGGEGPWPLVGRDALLADLVRALVPRRAAAREGEPSRVGAVLIGEAGTGKTRAMAAAVDTLLRPGAPVVRRLAATGSSRSIPFGALAPILPADFEQRDLHGNDLRVAADAIAATATSTAVGSEGPVRPVVVVDDAHHLDEASATVLLQLVLDDRIALVATVRSGMPVSDSVTALWKDGLLRRLDVGRLSEDEVAELTERVLGGPVGPAARRDLWSASAGNPLFLRELIGGARASGSLHQVEGLWHLREPVRSTAKLAELISARLGELSAGQRELLGLLSIAGRLGPDELAGAASDPGAVADDLIALEAREVVEVRSERRRWSVRLAHPLYGEVVEAGLPRLASRGLRLRLADAVERTGARRREDPMRIALWRIDGGGDVDVALAVRAARRALFSFDTELSERLARVAIDAGAGPDATLLLCELLHKRGAIEEADALFASVGGDDGGPGTSSSPDPRVRATATIHRATNLFYGFGQVDEAFSMLDAVMARTDLDEEREEAMAIRATLEMTVGNLHAARRLAEPLLEHASGRVLVNASIAEMCALAAMGDSDGAQAVARRALAVHESLGDQQMLARPWIHEVGMALAATEGGDLDAAEALAVSGHDAAVDRREPAAQGWFANAAGRLLLLRGRPRSAVRYFAAGGAVLAELGEMGPWRWAMAGQGIAAALLGDAAGIARAATAIAEVPSPMRLMETDVLRVSAWVRYTEGDHAGARAALHDIVARVAGDGAVGMAGHAAWDLARMGDAAAAARELAALRPHSAVLAVRADHADAVVARDAEALVAVADRLEGYGYLLEAAEARSAASLQLAREQRSREATALAHQVERFRSEAEGTTTRLLLAAAEQVPLTERQRDIALLAAEGRTSKEIAALLHLSPRTIDNNLLQVYARLGIAGRAELPAALGLPG